MKHTSEVAPSFARLTGEALGQAREGSESAGPRFRVEGSVRVGVRVKGRNRVSVRVGPGESQNIKKLKFAIPTTR